MSIEVNIIQSCSPSGKSAEHYPAETLIATFNNSYNDSYGYIKTIKLQKGCTFGIYINDKYATASTHYEKAIGLITSILFKNVQHRNQEVVRA
jgi:hypothetical protein